MAAREKYEVLMRLRAIELIALWEGKLNTQPLMQRFGISRQQASADIRLYNTEYNPASLAYSSDVKGYLPTEQFRPVFTHGHINEYMEMLSGMVSQTIPITLLPEPNIAAVHLPDRAIKPEVVRQLIQACRKQQSLKVTYASMSNPVAHTRTLSPHALIYSGFRWHVRAYCHTREDYRDFVLSRITRVKGAAEQPYISSENDSLWHEEVDLEIVPNQKLNKEQQVLIANDFVMKKSVLKLKVKKALVHYTLQRYQVGITLVECEDAYRFPLQLNSNINIDDLLFSPS